MYRSPSFTDEETKITDAQMQKSGFFSSNPKASGAWSLNDDLQMEGFFQLYHTLAFSYEFKLSHVSPKKMLLDTNSLLLCAQVEGQGGVGGGEESNLTEAKIRYRKDSKKKKEKF